MALRRPLLVVALAASLVANVWFASRSASKQVVGTDSAATRGQPSPRPGGRRPSPAAVAAPPAFCEAERGILTSKLKAARATVDHRRPPEWNFDAAAPNADGTQAVLSMARKFLIDNPVGKNTALGRAVAAGGKSMDQLINVECRGDSCRVWRAAAQEGEFNEFAQAFFSYSPERTLAAKDRGSAGVTGLRFRLAEPREVAIRSAFRDIGHRLRQQARTCEAEFGTATGVLQYIFGSGPFRESPPTYGDNRLWYSVAGTLTDTKVAACIEPVARAAVDQLSSTVEEAPYPMEQVHNVIFRYPQNG